MIWIIVVIIVLLLGLSFLVWEKSRSRRLSASSSSKVKRLLTESNRMTDPVLRLLEYDKILDQLLFELGYKGSTADKLKKGGIRFTNTQTLWKYHKLRNVIAHEHGAVASASDADHFRDALLQALQHVSR
jgi:cell division protein YceG involved in septum cleavage